MPTETLSCQLPEELRRYYLDLMGIQVWTENPVVADSSVAAAVAEVMVPTQADARQATQQVASAVKKSSSDQIWQSLQTKVATCTQCELHKSRSQTVFGVGDHQADVLIIGEAPGQEEDAQGEPFVGRAGKLLDAMLLAIGFQREQVYIANILKCRPPDNRDPRPEEVVQCLGYLQAQIDLLQPKVIFALGKVAAQNLLGTDATVSAMRGKLHDYRGIPLLVSYHPAYLLRKPTEKRKSWQDLQRLRAMLG